MKIRGMLLRTVEEQVAAGDDRPVDPEKIKFDTDKKYVVTVGFNPKYPPIGFAKVFMEDGRLYAEAELFDDVDVKKKLLKFAVGVVGFVTDMRDVRLVDLALVKENSDHGIPPFEVVEDEQDASEIRN